MTLKIKDIFPRQKFVLLVCSEHLTRSVELNITNIQYKANISYVLGSGTVEIMITGSWKYSFYYHSTSRGDTWYDVLITCEKPASLKSLELCQKSSMVNHMSKIV